jgi:hypothetical protein
MAALASLAGSLTRKKAREAPPAVATPTAGDGDRGGEGQAGLTTGWPGYRLMPSKS